MLFRSGFINEMFGQSVSFSDNGGQDWTRVLIAQAPGSYPNMLDKNHLWIDNSESSAHEGNVYAGWTLFSNGGANDGEVQISRSTTSAFSWNNPVTVSGAVQAGSHNQGVNIQTGPNGEVYAVWAVYDVWPEDENALGFARSWDGGQTFEPAWRILDNIKGIRNSLTSKNMRVNSFPSMAVDLSNGPHRGNIYVVWANKGIPGQNSGNEVDVYMIRSEDMGNTWSSPIKVNQDPVGMGKQHFFPWIACDPVTGNLSVIFYDDRNTSPLQCETYVAHSINAGYQWEDFRVSDVAFTPEPIPGLAGGYFGDYLGITAYDRRIYPCWTDNRSGKALAYVSPLVAGPAPGQPYVVYHSHELESSAGIPQTFLVYGDSVFLSVQMQNIGDIVANQVMVSLYEDSPYVQVLDGQEGYGDFLPSQTIGIPNGFFVAVSDSIPDNYKVKFRLAATDGDSIWNSHFYVVSSAPQLRIESMDIVDEEGNGNGIPDPGEIASIRLVLSNPGDFLMEDVECRLDTEAAMMTILQNQFHMNVLFPGQTDTAWFQVLFSEALSYGTLLDFRYEAFSGSSFTQKIFVRRAGLIIEDWETGDFLKFPWKRTGNQPWTIQSDPVYEGVYSARSGNIQDMQSSLLSLTYDIISDDSVTFYYKTSTEANYDFLSFFVDNVQRGRWSGIRDWKRAAFFVPAGRHTLRWQYEKDIYFAGGEDAVWIDYITLPVFAAPEMDAGPDLFICVSQDSVIPQATAGNGLSLTWQSRGDGYFINPDSLSPVYYPGPSDKLAGMVWLLLHAANEMTDKTDSLRLRIERPPLPPTGLTVSPFMLCRGETDSIFLMATAGEGEVEWFSSVCGENPMGSGAVLCIPSPSESSVYYARSGNSCGTSECSEVGVIVRNPVQPDIGPDTLLCSDQILVLDAGEVFYSYLWSDGSVNRWLQVDSVMSPVGQISWIFVEVTDSNGCHGRDSVQVSFVKCPQGQLEVTLPELFLFPNPSAGAVTVWIPFPAKDCVGITILDLSGKIVWKDCILPSENRIQMDFSGRLKPGSYLIEAKTGRIKTRGRLTIN